MLVGVNIWEVALLWLHSVGPGLVHQLVRGATNGVQVNLQKQKRSKLTTRRKKSSLTSFIVWKAAVTQSLKEEAVSAEAAFIW